MIEAKAKKAVSVSRPVMRSVMRSVMRRVKNSQAWPAGLLAVAYGSLAAVSAFGAVLGAAACSLGDGKTPECDAALEPGQANACREVAPCDDGHGGVLASDACCTEVAEREYRACEKNSNASFATCQGDKKPKCCGTVSAGAAMSADDLFQACKEGRLLTTVTGGAGGAGGAATGGGGGAGGLSTGGGGQQAGGKGGSGGGAK